MFSPDREQTLYALLSELPQSQKSKILHPGNSCLIQSLDLKAKCVYLVVIIPQTLFHYYSSYTTSLLFLESKLQNTSLMSN